MILFFLPNGLGDVLTAMPALRRLINNVGLQYVQVVVATPIHAELLRSTLGNDLEILIRFDGGRFPQLRLLWGIVKRRFDVCYAPLASNKLIVKIFFLLTFTRTIFPKSSIGESVLNLEKADIDLCDFPGHQVNYFVEFIAACDARMNHSPVKFDELLLNVKVEQANVKKFAERVVIAVGLSCGVEERHKIPHPQFFAKTINELVATGEVVEVLLIGTESDSELISEFERFVCGEVVVRKLINLPVTDVIRALATCDVGIVGTTGQGHMMASAGLPLVILAGVTEPLESGPYSSRVSILKHDLPCSPCYQEEFRFGCRQIACMDTLSATQGASMISRLLKDRQFGSNWLDVGFKKRAFSKKKILNIVATLLNR